MRPKTTKFTDTKECRLTAELRVEMGISPKATIGTGFVGYLNTGHDDARTAIKKICRAFGAPEAVLDSKITLIWRGKINGIIFTIYDYKKDGYWHIGGNYDIISDLINAFYATK